MVAKPLLLPMIARYNEEFQFAETFPISAIDGRGLDDLVASWIARLPEGPISVEVASASEVREGHALVESFRGDVFVWLRIGADGKIARGHLRDPSWFQWPLLEVAIEGNIVADFPLCNKSFNCSYSGHDL